MLLFLLEALVLQYEPWGITPNASHQSLSRSLELYIPAGRAPPRIKIILEIEHKMTAPCTYSGRRSWRVTRVGAESR